MQTFTEHYKEEQINEFNLEQLGKGFLRLGKNIFGKRVTGVGINLMTSFKNIDRSTYNFVQGVLTSNYKSHNKKDKKDKIFIKDVYKGEIDDSAKKLGGYENIKDQIEDISVYQTNRGGRITTFFLKDENENEHFYIGTNWRGDKQFKDLFGMWVTSLASRLQTMKKNNPTQSLQNILDEPKKYLLNPAEKEKTIENDSDNDSDNEIGIMDISNNEFISLQKIWGTGRKGGLTKREVYPFFNKFIRRRYENAKTGYDGYKYSDKEGHSVYLIDTGDGRNAFIVFESRDSYDWAENIEMLNYWRSRPGDKIRWQEGTIDNLE